MSKVVYLAGGMEYASDGKSWRDKTVKVLKEHSIASWEPYEQEAKLFNSEKQPAKLIKTLDKTKDFQELRSMMRSIVKLDLGVVRDEINALMVKYDESVLKGAGTHAEMSMAAFTGHPVFVWMPDLKMDRVPTWIIGCITFVSRDYDEVIEHVIEYTRLGK